MLSGEMSTSLQMESKPTRKSGKLKSAVSSVTNSAAENVKECRKFRLFVRDRRSNLQFLVDSGADVNIIPATTQNRKKAGYQLYAANGTEISNYGMKMLNLDLGLRRDFQFPFIIADVTKALKKDVELWTRTCILCQKAKIKRHSNTKFIEYEVPSGRFCILYLDLIVPFPPSRGNIYCLTCIDRFSSWMGAIPLDNISADTVARAFYSNWVARFGTPHKLITDRGTQLRSETLQTLSKICGIKLQHTTAYHPACNGKVERLHRTLNTALKAHNNLSWIDTLPKVFLGFRTAIQEDSNHTKAQIVYEESLRLLGEFLMNQVSEQHGNVLLIISRNKWKLWDQGPLVKIGVNTYLLIKT
ncbi:Retrovirus-related Pol polyprotein from transposon 412 [Araneus ventricosus]|uniref:Retrovirus-related Pol polyprotein from transposon 412 n=1 Tax=Araneus ventricosus TaxID=182803 RepID=A0A4Y2TIC6_ARAVE|nr:Retrovirus-related Pol polyprotein from transposon 412 [Araneus ventricosus]